jgi:hypothetical protein
MTLTIEDEWLVEKTVVGEHKISWKVVGPVISHENYFFILVNKVAALVINRNQVVSGNLDSFKEKIMEKALIKE